jgi:hypothetical protein
MLEQLTAWWQNVPPGLQTAVEDIGIVLVALVGGQVLGGIVSRALGARNFDAVLRLPGTSRLSPETEHGFTPTLIAGLFVRLSVWAFGVWWLANKHGQVEFAGTLALILRRSWALASVLVAALGLGSLLANRLIDCLQGVTKAGSEPAAPSRNGAAAPPRGGVSAAGAVGAGAYVLAILLVLLIASDSFDWPLTRSAALALWQFAQHLMVACAALLIGGLGARWAREQVTADGAASPEQRAGQYTALGIVAATTVLAVAVLMSSAGVFIGLATLAVLGLLLWLVRDYLPDVTAGFQLRANKVRQVWSDGVPWQVIEVGMLTTQVGRAGEFHQLRNRRVLEALLHEAPAEAVER